MPVPVPVPVPVLTITLTLTLIPHYPSRRAIPTDHPDCPSRLTIPTCPLQLQESVQQEPIVRVWLLRGLLYIFVGLYSSESSLSYIDDQGHLVVRCVLTWHG